MINICTDEAYAFDFLSILQIKSDRSDQAKETWQNCYNYIKAQLPKDLFIQIINSQEYENMVSVNKKTFDAVELARYGNISAKEVDSANMERHYAKIALQKKFFLTNLTEQKT
jgi:hypothetical protein